jgi:hypothetical protein
MSILEFFCQLAMDFLLHLEELDVLGLHLGGLVDAHGFTESQTQSKFY